MAMQPLFARLFQLCALLLAGTSAYLAAADHPHPLYFTSLLAHLGLGLVFSGMLLRWWRREPRPALLSGAVGLTLLSALAGVILVAVGNVRTTRWLGSVHGALAIAAAVVWFLWLLRGGLPAPWSRRAAWGLVALGLAPAATAVYTRLYPDPSHRIVNPPAPLTMAEEAMGGESGPYFPSSVSNAHQGLVPSEVYLEPESCGRSGCHPDLVDQWRSSVHHRSSFNNQWYRKSIEYMQETVGITASKWCAGCHDPALLQSGMFDLPVERIVDTPEAVAGLTCTACHMISSVRSTMGQGDYQITLPALHDLAASDNKLLVGVHDLLVRADPEPHRRSFLKPFMRGAESAEFCSSCHKVHLDLPVNAYRWIRGFNEYDNWQASGVSGHGARSFYYPPESKNCIDCHMPQVPSQDAGNKEGLIRSHRFAAANTALPVAYGDDEQLKHVIDFLQARQVTVDIFAMTPGRSTEEVAQLVSEGPALATNFAVGEESGMAVGSGGLAATAAEPVLAPLDRFPATVRRGESSRIDVVVRTRGVGHFFPGGTVDAYDCWLELQAVDSTGRTIYWSGMADESSPVESGAHFYRSRMIDGGGNPIDKRNAFHARAVVYVRLIPPGAADTARFRLDIPADTADEITLTARLNYRKFSWFYNHFAYAGEPLEGENASFGPHRDDRTFVFTADTAKVAGPMKEVPTLPIVVVAEDRQTLRVIDADAELPAPTIVDDPSLDRERWNDYGIGLFLAGDLSAAKAAFTRVTELQPGYADGFVNLGRVALAEGDLPEARRVLEHAAGLAPGLARTHFFLGLVDKEEGDYSAALDHLGRAAADHPKDRVVLNQIGRVQFLAREYQPALATLERVLAIDPEDLMAHYTMMLAARGAGELERSERHQKLYERFKADEGSQELTREVRERFPEDNRERQPVHEHHSPSRAEIEAFLARPDRAAPKPTPAAPKTTAAGG